MGLSWKDALATVFMAVNTLMYAAYLRGADVPLATSTRAVTAVILILGIVGGCMLGQAGEQYAHQIGASQTYVAMASLLGITALAAALVGLVTGSETALGVLFGATATLWLLATIRHTMTTAGERLGHR